MGQCSGKQTKRQTTSKQIQKDAQICQQQSQTIQQQNKIQFPEQQEETQATPNLKPVSPEEQQKEMNRLIKRILIQKLLPQCHEGIERSSLMLKRSALSLKTQNDYGSQTPSQFEDIQQQNIAYSCKP